MTLPSGEYSASSQPPKQPAAAQIFTRRGKIALNLISIVFWTYATVKLFVFDFDVYVIYKFAPHYTWLTQLRFVFLVAAIGLLFLSTKASTSIAAILYVALYPLVLIFWKLPAFIFKQGSWTLAFGIANSLISFFQNMRALAVKAALFFVSATIIFLSNNSYALAIASALLSLLLIFNYIATFVSVFKRSHLVVVYTVILNAWREGIAKTNKIDAEIKNLPVRSLSRDQLKVWTSNLEMQVLFTQACLFIARKLREYQRSHLNVASGVFTALTLLAMTIITFSILNLAIYKISNELYSIAKEPTFFDFFHYSFKTFLASSIKEIEPAQPLTLTLAMAENVFSLLWGIIFVSLIVSVRSKRHSEELDLAIVMAEGQGKLMEKNMLQEFKLGSIEEALSELEQAEASMIRVLYWFARNLK